MSNEEYRKNSLTHRPIQEKNVDYKSKYTVLNEMLHMY